MLGFTIMSKAKTLPTVLPFLGGPLLFDPALGVGDAAVAGALLVVGALAVGAVGAGALTSGVGDGANMAGCGCGAGDGVAAIGFMTELIGLTGLVGLLTLVIDF